MSTKHLHSHLSLWRKLFIHSIYLFKYLCPLPHNWSFNNPVKDSFEEYCWKRRKCWLPVFSTFQQCFLPSIKQFTFVICSFEKSTFLLLIKELMSKLFTSDKGLLIFILPYQMGIPEIGILVNIVLTPHRHILI